MYKVQLTLAAACIIVLIIVWIAPRSISHLSSPLARRRFDVYVINMDKDEARLKSFKRAYTRCDLSGRKGLIRWKGIDGRAVSIAEYVSSKALGEILRAERLKFRSKHYELTRGAIGCWLSHVSLWRSILESDAECALIFEDDAVMARNIGDHLKDLRPPRDWDIVLLGYMCNECDERPHDDMLQVKRFFGLHGYVIHRRGIKKFVSSKYSGMVTKQIDSVLSDMISEGALNVYAAPSHIVWQNNAKFATTIQMPLKKLRGVDEWE
jgi:GR25 family glycosyltransferase involved in LPS biosynthesis